MMRRRRAISTRERLKLLSGCRRVIREWLYRCWLLGRWHGAVLLVLRRVKAAAILIQRRLRGLISRRLVSALRVQACEALWRHCKQAIHTRSVEESFLSGSFGSELALMRPEMRHGVLDKCAQKFNLSYSVSCSSPSSSSSFMEKSPLESQQQWMDVSAEHVRYHYEFCY